MAAGWVDGWMEEGGREGWTDGRMDGLDGWMDGWMDGWKVEQTDVSFHDSRKCSYMIMCMYELCIHAYVCRYMSNFIHLMSDT